MSGSGDREEKAAQEPLDLRSRTALTLEEAAKSAGVGMKHLRSHLPEIPHLYLGRRLLIPVKPFEGWLCERAKAEEASSDRVAEEILREFDKK